MVNVEIDYLYLSCCTILKNPKLNCKLNTGHIHMLKIVSESYNLQPSNELKNTETGQELVNIQTDYFYPFSCIISQIPKMKLQAEYWPHSHDKNCIGKL